MKNKQLLILFSLLFGFQFLLLPVHAENGVTIEVQGISPIVDNNQIQAREMAVTDALRKAVEQVVGMLVDSRTDSKNYQIIQDTIQVKSTGYVSSYKVLNSWNEDGYCKVLVRAIVKRDAVKQSINELKLTLARAGKPRVMVLIDEPSVAAQITQGMIDSGFPAVDPEKLRQLKGSKLERRALEGDEQTLSKLAADYQVEILIIGEASPELIGETYGLVNCRAYLSIRAIRADTGQTLVSQMLDDRGADLNQDNAYRKALAKASDRMVEILRGELGKQLADTERTIQIEVSGINYSELLKLQRHLKETPGVSNLFLRNFEGSNALLDLETGLLSSQLAEIASSWQDLPLEVIGISGSKIEIKITKS